MKSIIQSNNLTGWVPAMNRNGPGFDAKLPNEGQRGGGRETGTSFVPVSSSATFMASRGSEERPKEISDPSDDEMTDLYDFMEQLDINTDYIQSVRVLGHIITR